MCLTERVSRCKKLKTLMQIEVNCELYYLQFIDSFIILMDYFILLLDYSNFDYTHVILISSLVNLPQGNGPFTQSMKQV